MENTNQNMAKTGASGVSTETQTKKCWACGKQEGHYTGCYTQKAENQKPTKQTFAQTMIAELTADDLRDIADAMDNKMLYSDVEAYIERLCLK